MTILHSRAGIAITAFALALGAGLLIGTITGARRNAAPVSVADASLAPVIHHVALTTEGARPGAVIARLGDQIQFDAKDGLRHQISQGTGDDFGDAHGHEGGVESPEFGDGESYLVTISQPGLYFFHDHEHPELTVSVVVYEEKNAE